jgi:autoinducer 2 (AI-2) kinase
LDPARHNRYTFYRAILENACLVTRGHVDLVEEATGGRPEEIVFAGGASKSPLWSQILADALGMPVRTPAVKEATALGAAILAGIGTGIYRDVAEGVDACVRMDATYTPNPDSQRVYEEMYPVWRQIYAAQLALCDKGLTKNMWIAPGL